MNALAFVPLPLAEQHRLIVDNVRLAYYLAHRMGGRLSSDERKSLALLGLCVAASKYDRSKSNFANYAGIWIRAVICAEAVRDSGLPNSDAARRIFFGLRKLVERYEAAGMDPTDEQLAAALRVPVAAVNELRPHMTHGPVFLDQYKNKQPEGRRHRDAVEFHLGLVDDAPQESEFERREGAQLRASAIKKALAKLKPRERTVIEKRFLGEPMTLQQIGDEVGLTRERIRQLEASALRKLRVALAGER